MMSFALLALGALAFDKDDDDKSNFCTSKDLKKLLKETIPNFGTDCDSYTSLFTEDGAYYHAHAGHYEGAAVVNACTAYASFCVDGDAACSFQVSGEVLTTKVKGDCHVLVPYVWAEIPASAANLEPHTGWEYIIAKQNKTNDMGYSIQRWSEIETTFSVPYNWAQPNDTSAMSWKLDAFKTYSQASAGECDNAIQPYLTDFFSEKTSGVWRQQGNAVALAAGGVCQLVVPYAASITKTERMQTGYFVHTLSPEEDSYTAAVMGSSPASVKFVSYGEQ